MFPENPDLRYQLRSQELRLQGPSVTPEEPQGDIPPAMTRFIREQKRYFHTPPGNPNVAAKAEEDLEMARHPTLDR
jgi:hypothetical protein